MTPKLSPEQREALEHSDPATVLKIVDPETKVAYVLMRADLYERYRGILEPGDFDVREAYPLMDAAARSAGWDDPAEDIYDDLDPRRGS